MASLESWIRHENLAEDICKILGLYDIEVRRTPQNSNQFDNFSWCKSSPKNALKMDVHIEQQEKTKVRLCNTLEQYVSIIGRFTLKYYSPMD